jgi:hypothetical protein
MKHLSDGLGPGMHGKPSPWILARDPDSSLSVALTESGKMRAFTFEGAKSIGMPSVTVVYELQEPFVIVHDVRFKDSDHGQTGHA